VTITRFHSTGRCLWERARRRIQKETAANRTIKRYWFSWPNARIRQHSIRSERPFDHLVGPASGSRAGAAPTGVKPYRDAIAIRSPGAV
jgi:hypothetical protein